MEQVKKITLNGKCAISLHGHITSNNASAVEAEIMAIIQNETIDELVLDAENLEYISSAGLRIILRLMKSGCKPQMINVSPEVYEILDVTGFSEMLPVQKAFRKVSIEGCEIIGQGSNGIVYRLDDETIVKVYRNNDALEEMQRERMISRKAFVLGIPTAIPYDVVRVGDKFGTVFELLNARSISKLIIAEPENIDAHVATFVDVLKTIHGTAIQLGELPSAKAIVLDWADYLTDHLPQDLHQKLADMISAVPDHPYLMHGDYHSNNVLVQNDEPLLIDMDTLCIGHPVFELASSYNAFVGFGEADPSAVKKFMNMDYATCNKIWEKMLPLYLNNNDAAYIQSVAEKAMVVGYTRLLRRTLRRDANSEFGQHCIKLYKSRLIELLSRVDSLVF